jgi:lipopolysaccharide/colanic/teichoic acid biosynthesis glycosyltransferase
MTTARLQSGTAAGLAAPSLAAALEPLQTSGRRRRLALLTAAIVVAILAAMPAAYALVALHGGAAPLADRKIQVHMAINCAANLVVTLAAVRTRDRLDRALGRLVTLTLLTHGTIAFVILVTRTYYSIPIMVLASLASFLWGLAAVLARGRLVKLRVAVVGPRHPILEDRNLACTRIERPDADLSGVDLVLVTGPQAQSLAADPFITRALLAGKRVRHVAEYMEDVHGVCALDHFDIDQISPDALARYRGLKRLLDIAFVVVALPVIVPILLVAMAAIAISMGWPILFVQPRVGLKGRTFRIYKLRTMRPQPAGAASCATLAADSRVTPLGRFLRRFRIDELPQFLNVIVGDMSLIGPRPEQPALFERYAAEIPQFAFRLLAAPGITGWAQVRAGYAANADESRVKLGYDLFYIKNFSLGLDLRILAWTVWTLTQGGGVR